MAITRESLKIIAIILMTIEHSSGLLAYIFNQPSLNYILHYSGRIVFPIFVYLMVEGYFKTSNVYRYIFRVFLTALLVSIFGNLLIYTLSILLSLDINTLYSSNISLFRILAPTGMNVLWSLGIGLALIHTIELFKHSNNNIYRLLLVFTGILLFLLSLITEFTIITPILFLTFYIFFNNKLKLTFVYISFCIFYLINALLNIEYFWTLKYQWMMVFALPLIILYNGSRGKYNLNRYFFYIYYPLHIWIIYILEVILKIRGS